MRFLVTEMRLSTGQPTGYTAIHVADTIAEAVKQVLYTAQLKDARALVGPTGRVVNLHGRGGDVCRVVTAERK